MVELTHGCFHVRKLIGHCLTHLLFRTYLIIRVIQLVVASTSSAISAANSGRLATVLTGTSIAS
jgi:hypothetical protein